MAATWTVRLDGEDRVWDWGHGAPPVRELVSVRRPSADAMSRHAPVRMWSLTTGSYLVLESGLEYELARSLDREASVSWLVPQPVRIAFDTGSSHVPDLLVEHADGQVVIWDARPLERQDERFVSAVELSRAACEHVGWEYEVHAGLSPARRLNLMWLTVFRHRPEWPHHDAKRELLARAGEGVTVREILADDAGDGHLTATMWHLMWTGEVAADLDVPITATTLMTVGVERSDG